MKNTCLSTSLKRKSVIEIIACYFMCIFFSSLFRNLGRLFQTDDLWFGIMTYFFIASTILFYVVRIEKKPLCSIGLKRISIREILFGILMGMIMFMVQQIPLLLMGMDYKILAVPPDLGHIIVMSVYCIFCVGFTEELMMRGFILNKSIEITKSKIILIVLNSIIFYSIHWPPIRFVFGEAFNITLNTTILCGFLFFSKKKSISPLIIAHGTYDILSAYLLPAFMYMLIS